MRSLIVAVNRYSGSPGDAAEVDGFAVVEGAEEQALSTVSKAQDKASERNILIKTSGLHGSERRASMRTYNVQLPH
jgi:hypothetical protein